MSEEEKRTCEICKTWYLNGKPLHVDNTLGEAGGLHHGECRFAGATTVERRSGKDRRKGDG